MKRTIYYFLAIAITLVTACSKVDDYLDKRLSLSDVTPTTLAHFQALLDNDTYLMNSNYNTLGFLATDQYFIDDNDIPLLTPEELNVYTWQKDLFESDYIGDWTTGYLKIFQTNVVLDGLENIDSTTANAAAYRQVKGSALFFRAFQYYNQLQTFCLPYSPSNLSSPGVPLRLTADVNVRPGRGTIAEGYERVIADLRQSVVLLPTANAYATRPNKTAAHALLARVLLAIGDYSGALEHANEALTLHSALLDYNSVTPTSRLAFPRYPNLNEEVIFLATMSTALPGIGFHSVISSSYVDTTLVASYDANDLRKTILYVADTRFPERMKFRGSYTGGFILFGGLATNELYLIKAECLARTSQPAEAMQTLNTLLEKRWLSSTFQPLAANDSEEAISIIIRERRKELPFTAQTRWDDIRRLNAVAGELVNLQRTVNGVTYTLQANSNRYAYPIPGDEVRLFGLPQNPRD